MCGELRRLHDILVPDVAWTAAHGACRAVRPARTSRAQVKALKTMPVEEDTGCFMSSAEHL